ncbi:hypothetical protein [Chamaesiphon sp. VAR_48_metabat_403]|uniref:hypothetical protein n=1 Tax=Chamaesiphon sp. VAR_48_metabat_403 TaxID=2964700 RepID=UPI00286D7218|nr:hypothetical protein [Chamaesiphon sp. VAR_48_metabat_403]
MFDPQEYVRQKLGIVDIFISLKDFYKWNIIAKCYWKDKNFLLGNLSQVWLFLSIGFSSDRSLDPY